MNEHQTAVVGIDIGTTTVRCAIGLIKPEDQTVSVVGVGEAPNSGFRKGSVVNITEVVQAVDQAIAHAERMAGAQVTSATININGEHIKGLDSRGVIAVSGHEITDEDIARAEDAATVLQLPVSHEILNVFPRSYNIDGNSGIKDPIGMSGTRLEVDAHVVSVSGPVFKNLEKVAETTKTAINRLTVSSLASAQAVLTREQRENGVAVLDIGAATTNLIVVEDGDVQHIAVIGIGGTHVTNDLAIGLRTDLKVAESVKKNYKYLGKSAKDRPKHIKVVVNRQEYIFPTKDIELIITARLEELFEAVDTQLAKVHRSKKLPGGVTLTGGGAQLAGIEGIARDTLQLSCRVGTVSQPEIGGLKEKIARSDYATVAGLMLLDVHKGENHAYGGNWLDGRFKHSADQARSLAKRLFGRFGF